MVGWVKHFTAGLNTISSVHKLIFVDSLRASQQIMRKKAVFKFYRNMMSTIVYKALKVDKLSRSNVL